MVYGRKRGKFVVPEAPLNNDVIINLPSLVWPDLLFGNLTTKEN